MVVYVYQQNLRHTLQEITVSFETAFKATFNVVASLAIIVFLAYGLFFTDALKWLLGIS